MKTNRKKEPAIRKVKEIEVSKQHLVLRIVLLVVFIMLALFFFGYFIFQFLNPEEGWTLVESDSSYANTSSIIDFYYDFDKVSIADKKDIKRLYTEASVNAFRIFDEKNAYDNYNNINTLNTHPNEIIEVDKALYKALKIINDSSSRFMYYEPMFIYIESVANSENDSDAKTYDSKYNNEVKEYYEKLSAYVSDPSKINIELFDDYKVRLNVSSDYLELREDEGIDCFIGLCELGQIFMIDYLSDVFLSHGYLNCYFVDKEGSFRTLSNEEMNVPISKFDGNEISLISTLTLNKKTSFVGLKSYPISDSSYPYYIYGDKTITNGFIDSNGIQKTSIDSLYSYDSNLSCAEVALKILDIYISDTFNAQRLKDTNLKYIYSLDNKIYYNDYGVLSNINDKYQGVYVND